MDYLVIILFLIFVICCLVYRLHFVDSTIKIYADKYDKHSELIKKYEAFQTGTADNNLFVKYGLGGVQTIVDNIATNAGADSQLAPFFAVLDKPGHDSKAVLKSTLDLQLSALLGAGWVYPGRGFTRGVCPMGRSMKASHKGLNIPDSIFTRFLNVAVVPALQQAGVSASDIQAAAPLLEAMRRDIISS